MCGKWSIVRIVVVFYHLFWVAFEGLKLDDLLDIHCMYIISCRTSLHELLQH